MLGRETTEWCDMWVEKADNETPDRILLVGDSITRSYYPFVLNGIGPDRVLARLATSKSICDEAFGKELAFLLDDYVFIRVHVNNGLHGWFFSEEQYKSKTAEVMDFFCQYMPTGSVVWATTTPVRDKNDMTRMGEVNDRVTVRNRIVTDLAAERNIPVNDLYRTVIDHPEYYVADGVHFNDQGCAALGGQVTAAILATFDSL